MGNIFCPPSSNDDEVSVLVGLMKNERWDAVLERIRTGPGKKELQIADDGTYGGVLPLHWLCARGAPPPVVEGALAEYPKAASTRDDYGKLPLHHASARGADASSLVVTLLLDAYPEGAKTADVALGQLPIHWAAGSKASLSVMTMLVDAYPQGVATRDNRGNLPVQLLAVVASPNVEEDVTKVDLLLRPMLRLKDAGDYVDGGGGVPVADIAGRFGLSSSAS